MEKPLPRAAAFRWIKKRREVEKSLVCVKRSLLYKDSISAAFEHQMTQIKTFFDEIVNNL